MNRIMPATVVQKAFLSHLDLHSSIPPPHNNFYLFYFSLLLQMEIKMVPELSAKYADKPRSKACFLFYSGGKVVGEVLGCDAPSIMREPLMLCLLL